MRGPQFNGPRPAAIELFTLTLCRFSRSIAMNKRVEAAVPSPETFAGGSASADDEIPAAPWSPAAWRQKQVEKNKAY